MNNEPIKPQVDVDVDTYDRGIVPAETAARKEREGDLFKSTPDKIQEQQPGVNDRIDPESINTTDGYTVDKEGLLNNYAIEPEMYINEPGDLREKEETLESERLEELQQANEDKDGELTMENDNRGRGPGIV